MVCQEEIILAENQEIVDSLPLSSQPQRLRNDLHNDRGISELGNSMVPGMEKSAGRGQGGVLALEGEWGSTDPKGERSLSHRRRFPMEIGYLVNH